MKSFVKQFLIIILTFIIILWVQNEDDLKNNIQRKSLYEKYKIPFLAAACVGLVINYFRPKCSINIIDIAEDFGMNEINFNNVVPEYINNVEVPNKSQDSIKNLLNSTNILKNNKSPEVFLDQPDF